MDTLCGIGLPELIILALLGFVVIGPERSREVALSLGRMLGAVMKSEWWGEVNHIAQAIRNLPTTLVRMAELEESLKETEREMQETQDELRRTLGGEASSPPSPSRPSEMSTDKPQKPPERELDQDTNASSSTTLDPS